MKLNQNSLSLSSDSFSKNHPNQKSLEEKITHSFYLIIRQSINFLIGNNEPKIWQYQTKSGELIWQIYDPKTGKTEQFFSDKDVRIWIEQQYYR